MAVVRRGGLFARPLLLVETHVIGLRYRRTIGTEFTVCPERVVSQTGDFITLATGERLKIIDVPTTDISAALADASGHVRVDRAPQSCLPAVGPTPAATDRSEIS
jgi:hypothetical protein